ncbi:MAG: hypothetical protein R2932_41350 [Caldilineaceae bacterium]
MFSYLIQLNDQGGIQQSLYGRSVLRRVSQLLFALLFAVTSLASTQLFGHGGSVALASCQAPDIDVLGDWVNVEVYEGPYSGLHTLSLNFSCNDHVLCPIGGECRTNSNPPYWASVTYDCDNTSLCQLPAAQLSIDPYGRQAWFFSPIGPDHMQLSASYAIGPYGEELSVQWTIIRSESGRGPDIHSTARFIRHSNVVTYKQIRWAEWEAELAQTEEPSLTPWPTATMAPTPTPTAIPAPFRILGPANGTCIEHSTQIDWVDTIGLAAGHVYEIVVWRSGEDPMSQSRGITKADLRTSRLIDMDYLDDQRDWFGPGEFRWGILEIISEPYQRIRLLADGGTFRFVRGTACD